MHLGGIRRSLSGREGNVMKDIESIDVRKVYRGVRRDAQKQITDHFDLLVADQRDRRTAHYEAEEDAAATLGRLLGSDEKYPPSGRASTVPSTASFRWTRPASYFPGCRARRS